MSCESHCNIFTFWPGEQSHVINPIAISHRYRAARKALSATTLPSAPRTYTEFRDNPTCLDDAPASAASQSGRVFACSERVHLSFAYRLG